MITLPERSVIHVLHGGQLRELQNNPEKIKLNMPIKKDTYTT